MLKEMLKKTPKRIGKNESNKSNVPDGMLCVVQNVRK